MPDWDPSLYLHFKAQRTQPAHDLAARIPLAAATRILDLGCGPGNSTAAVAARYPGAAVLGVDSSPDMIDRARREHPEFSFQVCEVPAGLAALPGGFDVVFSNACIQWIPEHRTLLPALLGLLRPGGVLAVQIPIQQEQPTHRLALDIASQEKWRTAFPTPPRTFHTLSIPEYFDILAELTPDFSLWEIVYHHRMPGLSAMLEWYRATGLRPYLEKLDEAGKRAFEAELCARLAPLYPPRKNGEILFRFPRLFFTAVRPDETHAG